MWRRVWVHRAEVGGGLLGMPSAERYRADGALYSANVPRAVLHTALLLDFAAQNTPSAR